MAGYTRAEPLAAIFHAERLAAAKFEYIFPLIDVTRYFRTHAPTRHRTAS